MIEYIKKLFTTPELKLSVIDQLAIVGICVFAFIVFLLLLYFIYKIYLKIYKAIQRHKAIKWYKKHDMEIPEYYNVITLKRGAGREYNEQHRKSN